MFGQEFYPTPPKIVEKMIEGIRYIGGLRILEPSAGKGDIIDAINRKINPYGHKRDIANAFCIEIDPLLQAVLREKGHKVIATDFLDWVPNQYYELILMNPPFSSGDKHLLHAWNILDKGKIVCLLNEETVKSPNTKRRQLLADIIRQHGTIEYLGDCFSTAERKTNVRVSLVRLEKDEPDEFTNLFKGLEFEKRGQVDDDEPEDVYLPADRDVIGNMCLQYTEALKLFKEAKLAWRKLMLSVAPLSKGFMEHRERDYIISTLKESNYRHAVNEFTTEFTRSAWATLSEMAGVRQLMTAGVVKEFKKLIAGHEAMDFTEENIFMFLDTLRNSVGGIMQGALLEVFNLLTKYHDENRVHIEGWKTNDAYAVGQRFILPNVVKYEWENFRHSYYHREQLNDIDRVLCSLEGKKIDDVVSVYDALDKDFKAGTGKAESEFFILKYYKKGTVHFQFKSRSLWERFNVEAAKGREWLPHDFKYREGCLKIAA